MECLAQVLETKYSRFNTVSPQHQLSDALYQMSCEHLDYLIVQEEEVFIGLLSEQDIVQKLFTGNKSLEQLQVKDVMNLAVPVGDMHDRIDFAMEVMDRYNSRYIAVFDQIEFRGIVSENDLLRQMIRNREKDLVPDESFHWSY